MPYNGRLNLFQSKRTELYLNVEGREEKRLVSLLPLLKNHQAGALAIYETNSSAHKLTNLPAFQLGGGRPRRDASAKL